MAGSYSIGDLAEKSGTKVPTIRYYEQSKLMTEPGRTTGNQRRYGQADLDRLIFIRHSRELGFSIEDIRELLRLSNHPDAPCDAVDALTAKHLDEVELKIRQLQALRRELKRMIGECQHGPLRTCRIVETLSDHRLCRGDH